VGLIQNSIENVGIATISVTMKPEITYYVQVPRSAHIRFPLGNPIGEANKIDDQKIVVHDLLRLFEIIQLPGTIFELPYRWKRKIESFQGE
tara:strand:+ start:8588 stop:8860 length:273 start_codon:yes stop_codon:yes gene_type:complete